MNVQTNQYPIGLHLWLIVCALFTIELYAEERVDEVQKDPPLVISAGREDGGYWGVAKRLQQVAMEKELRVTVIVSTGSMENLKKLDDPGSPVALGLTQADALKNYLESHPDFLGRIKILESAGPECIFVIAGNQGKIDTSGDLHRNKGIRLAIPGPESGTAVTFRNISRLKPEYAGIAVTYMAADEALKAIDNAAEPRVDALMLVQHPKVHTAEIRYALEHPQQYRFVPIKDLQLSERLPDGQPVYESLDLPLQRSTWDNATRSVETICTKGLLVGAWDKLSASQRDILKHILDFDWMRIYDTGK